MQETEEAKILKMVAETFTEKPNYKITVDVLVPDPIKKITFWDRIRGVKAEEPESERTFTFHPCVVGNMYRIAGKAVTLPKEILSNDLSESVIPLIPDHLPTIVYIIASAIQNNHLEPEPDIIRFIERNFNHEQLFVCLHKSIENLGMQSFLSSIVSARGTVKVLNPETSPEDGSELIASHTEA